jgi:hypothetical protein
MILKLPGVVYWYFAAQAASDVEAMARCFTPTGTIRDQRGCARGLAAIRRWLAAKPAHGRTTQLFPIPRSADATVVLASAVSDGRTSGAPVEHRFRVENGKIAALELC